MTVSAVDTGTDLPANNWTATVNLSPAEVGTGVPGTEVLSVPSVNLSNGPVTVSQAYTQAGTFNFVLNDGSLPPSTSASPILMRPGPLAKLETDLPATLEAGQSQIINITLLDAYDNPIPNAPAEFSLSDSSFGTLSTLSGVTNAQGQTATTFVTNGQKSGSGIFTARSQGFDVDQGFRLLGPPSTTIRAGGRAVEEAKGISIKPGDPLYLDVQVETGVTLTEVRYSFDGGASWTTEPGPFTITEGRAVVDVLPLLTVVGQYAVQFYGVTQSVLAHTETIKTSKPIFVSAETGAGEGLVNYPNPFRAGRDLTFLEYTLDAAAGVRLTIYDLLGQRVYERSYSQGESGGEAGANRISWDGRNGDGMTVANGGYVAVLETATGTKMKRKIAVRK
jgi:hypothetical protein